MMAGTPGLYSANVVAASGEGFEYAIQDWRTAGDRMAVESGAGVLRREENAGEVVDRALHDICVRYGRGSSASES